MAYRCFVGRWAGNRVLQLGGGCTRLPRGLVRPGSLQNVPPSAAAFAPQQQYSRATSSATSTAVAPVDIIAKKREGEELTAAEIHSFVQKFTAGEVADYQMAAWLMAVCLRGMTPSETAELTLAMVQSGSVADLSDIPGAKSGALYST